MGALLVASVASGQLVSRTGRYKWMPIVGGLLVAVALVLLSTLKPEAPLWKICAYLAVTGLGLSTQIMVLIVQNSFPLREVGTATASNNFFRRFRGRSAIDSKDHAPETPPNLTRACRFRWRPRLMAAPDSDGAADRSAGPAVRAVRAGVNHHKRVAFLPRLL
ncbi:hypothetical protein [Arthrobacter sp. UYEF3]|uniref:hypothetical protein n=1 Tax=Arthrobacter sp. UYEF3 TaxID=1756365 RepID=UPI00339A013A